jgi:hypothetical protein
LAQRQEFFFLAGHCPARTAPRRIRVRTHAPQPQTAAHRHRPPLIDHAPGKNPPGEVDKLVNNEMLKNSANPLQAWFCALFKTFSKKNLDLASYSLYIAVERIQPKTFNDRKS